MNDSRSEQISGTTVALMHNVFRKCHRCITAIERDLVPVQQLLQHSIVCTYQLTLPLAKQQQTNCFLFSNEHNTVNFTGQTREGDFLSGRRLYEITVKYKISGFVLMDFFLTQQTPNILEQNLRHKQTLPADKNRVIASKLPNGCSSSDVRHRAGKRACEKADDPKKLRPIKSKEHSVK